MQAEPKRWPHNREPRVVPLPDARDGLWIQCEVTHPPSRAGQAIDLYLTAEDITHLVTELRTSAIQARLPVAASRPTPEATA